MTTTPDVQGDLIARAVVRLPLLYSVTGAARNVWAGQERVQGGEVPRRAAFARLAGERQLLYAGGQAREIDLQWLMRNDPQEGLDIAELRARQTYDGLHLSGAFVGGASGVRYCEIWAMDAPRLLTDAYYVLNLTLLVDA